MVTNYLTDWIKPTITVENKVKGQTVTTGSNFIVKVGSEDNLSKYLFYSLDGGNTYYLRNNGYDDVTIPNVQRSVSAILNNIIIRVCDINDDIAGVTLLIWGILK